MGAGGREGGSDSMLSAEPDAELNPTTLRSQPELKSSWLVPSQDFFLKTNLTLTTEIENYLKTFTTMEEKTKNNQAPGCPTLDLSSSLELRVLSSSPMLGSMLGVESTSKKIFFTAVVLPIKTELPFCSSTYDDGLLTQDVLRRNRGKSGIKT